MLLGPSETLPVLRVQAQAHWLAAQEGSGRGHLCPRGALPWAQSVGTDRTAGGLCGTGAGCRASAAFQTQSGNPGGAVFPGGTGTGRGENIPPRAAEQSRPLPSFCACSCADVVQTPLRHVPCFPLRATKSVTGRWAWAGPAQRPPARWLLCLDTRRSGQCRKLTEQGPSLWTAASWTPTGIL